MNRKYYILANGEGTRWNNYMGVPKQLIEINGETILHRMVRLLNKFGVQPEGIFVCGKFEVEGAQTLLTKSKTKREVFEEIANHAQCPFVILYGDCYYTQECIREVVFRPVKQFDEFFLATGNPNTGCSWPEGYAHRCDDWEWWLEKMHELNSNPELIKMSKDWFIHNWLIGIRDERMNKWPKQCANPDHDIYWCDQTDDFDFPSDLDKFCEVTGHQCTNKLNKEKTNEQTNDTKTPRENK